MFRWLTSTFVAVSLLKSNTMELTMNKEIEN